jgi:hypothetical protein
MAAAAQAARRRELQEAEPRGPWYRHGDLDRRAAPGRPLPAAVMRMTAVLNHRRSIPLLYHDHPSAPAALRDKPFINYLYIREFVCKKRKIW